MSGFEDIPALLATNAGQAAGTTLEVRTRLGAFTIDPASGNAAPGDSAGNSGLGAFGLAVLRWLNLSFTIHTPIASIGPFQANL